jgi:hypothetical protein
MASPSKKNAVKSMLRNPLLGGHRGREPNKFQFDITVDRVVGGSAADYSVKWCRGVKTASTTQFQAAPKSKDGVAVGQKLSLLCTLYRAKATEAHEFEPKDSKLSLISHKDGKKNDKTVGKVHFNLSDFAGVPSATATHSFQLNAKARVDATITCTFVRVSRGTASSCGSGMSGMTVSSGEFEGQGNDDFADLDDLPMPRAQDLDDMLSPVSPVAAGSSTGARDAALEDARGVEAADSTERTRANSAASPSALASTKSSRAKARESVRASGAGAFKSRAKVAALESDVEQLQHQLAESQKEAEKSRVLHQMSEDIIRELREKIEYNGGPKAASGASREKELQERVDHLERAAATAAIDLRKMTETYDSRIVTLNAQVETMERSKARLEGENRAIRDQLVILESSAESGSGRSAVAAEARDKLISEASSLRREAERLAGQLQERVNLVATLEAKGRETSTEMERLHAKLDAHEEHGVQVKSTYEDLSKMYTDLRDEHAKLHAELTAARQDAKLAPRSSSGDVKRFMRRSKAAGQGTAADDDKPDDVARDEEARDLKSELQEKRRLLVECERAKSEAQRQVANVQSDVEAAKDRALEARKETARLTERLEAAKTKHLNVSEQLETALQAVTDGQVELETVKRQCQQEVQQLRAERADEVKKLRQAAVQAASSGGSSDERVQTLEQSLAEAAEREDQYEEEILKMTQIMDGLTNKLTETKALADARASESDLSADNRSSKRPDGAAAATGLALGRAGSDTGSAEPARCKTCRRGIRDADESDSEQPSMPEKRTRTGRGQLLGMRRAPSTTAAVAGGAQVEDNFISSSRIRKMNLFEKITDGRLLNMLVETKMKLAIAEEEKVGRRRPSLARTGPNVAGTLVSVFHALLANATGCLFLLVGAAGARAFDPPRANGRQARPK